MKKLLSLVLTAAMLMALTLPVSAANAAGTEYFTGDDYVAYETTDSFVILAWEDTGAVVIAAANKNTDATVYQWIGRADNLPQNLTAQKLAAAVTVSAVAQMSGVESFTPDVPEVEVQGGSQTIKNMVLEDLEDRYGAPKTAWPVLVDTTSYAPLIFAIRQTDTVEALYDYRAEFEMGWRLATLITAMVSAGSTVVAATNLARKCFNAADTAYEIQSDGYIDTYTGNYISQRISIANPQSANETPVHYTTKTIKRYYSIVQLDVETNPGALEDSGAEDILYAPSEYEYQADVMVDEAYDYYT